MTKQETNIQRLLELGWTEKPGDTPTKFRTFEREGLEADAWADGTVDLSTSNGMFLHLRTGEDVDDALQAARDYCQKKVAAYRAALEALG